MTETMALAITARIPQLGGTVRYYLDTPATARASSAAIARDRAMIDGVKPLFVVDVHAGRIGRITVQRWPSTMPVEAMPWRAIRAALRKE